MTTSPADLHSLLSRARFTSTGIGSNLSLHLEWSEPLLVLRVSGTSSDALPDAFTAAVATAIRTVRPARAAVDLTACQSLPSVILAFLVYFQKTFEEHGTGKVVLFGANPRILTVIKMIGMLDFFLLLPDEAAARSLIGSQAH